MVCEMGSNLEALWHAPLNLGTHSVAKLFVSLLLLGAAFYLFFSYSNDYVPIFKTRSVAMGSKSSASLNAGQGKSQREKCDLFTGKWIPNPFGPTYTSGCRFIEDSVNCLRNGRPDTGYLYWRWKPRGCNLPPFDAEKFLGAMRNKNLALVGDSIHRNYAGSFICLLSKAEEALEVWRGEQHTSRRWHFPSYNFTLSQIWSPFLVKAETLEDRPREAETVFLLHIDALDTNWTEQYGSFDYVVISGGHWYLKTSTFIYLENNTLVGCHNCHNLSFSELRVDHIYRKVLSSVFKFATSSRHKPIVMYRTWTPDHYEHGEWFSGGGCNRTAPYKKGEYDGKDVDRVMRGVELEEFERAIGLENGAQLKLLDTYQLSLLRPDGHSGHHWRSRPLHNKKKKLPDCLHWCLPGALDAWSDLIMELVLNE